MSYVEKVLQVMVRLIDPTMTKIERIESEVRQRDRRAGGLDPDARTLLDALGVAVG